MSPYSIKCVGPMDISICPMQYHIEIKSINQVLTSASFGILLPI